MTGPEIVIVAGHAVCIAPASPWESASWVLLDFQRDEVPYYVEHIQAGVRRVATKPESLLIFSGGQTRPEAGPKSEAASYFQVAGNLKWFGCVGVARRTVMEEFARDSYENLLYSICRTKQITGDYPSHVTLVGWEFKRERFQLHRRAIGWPAERFTYLGANNPPDLQLALAAEARNREAYQRDPYSAGIEFRMKRQQRNPFHRTPDYLETCTELNDLFQHNGPELFSGNLPWGPGL